MTKILFMYHLFRSASELTAVITETEFSLFLMLLLTTNVTLFYAAPLLYIIINNSNKYITFTIQDSYLDMYISSVVKNNLCGVDKKTLFVFVSFYCVGVHET